MSESEHEDFYTDMHIDKQIDALLQGHIPSPRDRRMAADLRAILEHGDEGENARSLQKVYQRLLAQPDLQSTQKIVSITDHHLQGRFIPMQQQISTQKPQRMRSLLRIWGTVAAVLLIAALVGSMLVILNIAHQPRAGSSPTVGESTATAIVSPTPTPALPEGQIVYQSAPFRLTQVPVVWSPGGTRVAMAINDTAIESWDALTGQHVLKYPLGNLSIASQLPNVIAWSPDGRTLAVATSSEILLFNARTAQLIRTLSLPHASSASSGPALSSPFPLSGGGGFGIEDVNWSSDGQEISAFTETGIAIWNAQSGSLITQLKGVYLFNSTISVRELWQPHGQHLASIRCANQACSATEISLWDTTTWSIVKQYPSVDTFDWSPNGSQLALVNMARTQVLLVNALTGQQVKQISAPRNQSFFSVQWSPDGSRLLLGTVTNLSPLTTNLSIWSVTSGEQIYVFSRPNCELARWAPTSQYLSCIQANQNGTGIVLVWVA